MPHFASTTAQENYASGPQLHPLRKPHEGRAAFATRSLPEHCRQGPPPLPSSRNILHPSREDANFSCLYFFFCCWIVCFVESLPPVLRLTISLGWTMANILRRICCSQYFWCAQWSTTDGSSVEDLGGWGLSSSTVRSTAKIFVWRSICALTTRSIFGSEYSARSTKICSQPGNVVVVSFLQLDQDASEHYRYLDRAGARECQKNGH